MILGILTDCNGEFHLWPLLFLLLAALLGWLLKSLFGGKTNVADNSSAINDVNNDWSAKYAKLEAELKKLKSSKANTGFVAAAGTATAATAIASNEPLSEVNRWKDKAQSFEKNIELLKNEKALMQKDLDSKTLSLNTLTSEHDKLKTSYNFIKGEIEQKAALAATAPAPKVEVPKVEEEEFEADDEVVAPTISTMPLDEKANYEAQIAALKAAQKEADEHAKEYRERLHLSDKKNTELEMRIKTASEMAGKASALEAKVASLESGKPLAVTPPPVVDNSALNAANAKIAALEAAAKTNETAWQAKIDAANQKAAEVKPAEASPVDNSALNAANAKIAQLEADIKASETAWNARLAEVQNKQEEPMAMAAPAPAVQEAATTPQATATPEPQSAPTPTAKANDLTKVEGIGPAIAKLFNEAGVHSFDDLAKTTEAQRQAVLTGGGERFKMHNPGTWAKQAELLRDGKKEELAAYQEYLDGGVDPAAHPDDLTKIEGIGPVIAGMLNNGGIYTFKKLAASSQEKLQSILDAGGERFRIHSPATWPTQSELARDGKWDELQKLQDELKGGREA